MLGCHHFSFSSFPIALWEFGSELCILLLQSYQNLNTTISRYFYATIVGPRAFGPAVGCWNQRIWFSLRFWLSLVNNPANPMDPLVPFPVAWNWDSAPALLPELGPFAASFGSHERSQHRRLPVLVISNASHCSPRQLCCPAPSAALQRTPNPENKERHPHHSHRRQIPNPVREIQN